MVGPPPQQSIDDPLDRLRRMAVRVGGSDGAWLVDCIEQFDQLRSSNVTFDSVMGLSGDNGVALAWVQSNKKRRNELILAVKAEFFPKQSRNAAAKAISLGLGLYKSNGWTRDRNYPTAPDTLKGVNRRYFEILKLDVNDLCQKQVNRILI